MAQKAQSGGGGGQAPNDFSSMTTKAPAPNGVDVTPRRPGRIGDPGPARRPTQGNKQINPYLDATANPKGPQVKGKESQPTGNPGSEVQSVLAASGSNVAEQLVSKTSKAKGAKGNKLLGSNTEAEPFTDSNPARTTGNEPMPQGQLISILRPGRTEVTF